MPGRRTLADQLAELSNPTPDEYKEDISFGDEAEAGEVDGWEDEAADADADLSEYAKSQRLRLRSDISLTEGKYKGKPSSRAKFDFETLNAKDEDEDEVMAESSSEEESESADGSSDGDETSSEMDDDEDLMGMYGAADQMQEQLQGLQEEAAEAATIKLVSDTKKELGKAAHAKNQKSLWDTALQMRIKQQRLLSGANRLPQGAALLAHCEAKPETEAVRKDISKGLQDVLAMLLELGSELKSANPECADSLPPFFATVEGETKKSRKRKREALVCPEDKDPARFYWKRLKRYEDSYAPFQERTLESWNRKTQLMSRISASKFKAINQNVMAQVRAVMQEPERLVERTYGTEKSGRVLGTKVQVDGEREKDAEVFDDTAFYQQLLKELIEQETSTADGVDISRQWLKSRSLNKSRGKDVDRKASKGRKLRYTVHEKLVDFMTPSEKEMPDVAIDLFKNLFQ